MAKQKINNQQTNFSQTASSNGYITIGGVLIQWGENSASSVGTGMTFPVAFSSTPRVMVNLNDPGAQDARAYNINTTGCVLRQSYVTSALPVQWLAIGGGLKWLLQNIFYTGSSRGEAV